MKKILFAVLASTFATALMADYVYDYKASIKRIDPSYKVRTVNKAKAVTSSYNVVSDTLSGYVVVPACVACDENGVSSSVTEDFAGTAYIVRKGNKYAKQVLKTPVTMASAIFGAYVNNTGSSNENDEEPTRPLASIKDSKKAWMYLAYASQDSRFQLPSNVVLKKVTSTDLNYGFLGFDNVGIVEIEATGFGAAKFLGWTEAAELGFCGQSKPNEFSCQIINSISGTLIGFAEYDGACSLTPMWDLCYTKGDEEKNIQPNVTPVADAVISGTWTLKFNKSLSTVASADKEDAILKKLKADGEDWTIVNGEDFKNDNLGE